jgi:hypothetical protein
MRGSPASHEAMEELERMKAEFTLPAGLPGSGRRRYAAAMWFYLHGVLSEDELETYRALAMDDRADPVTELRRIGTADAALRLMQ